MLSTYYQQKILAKILMLFAVKHRVNNFIYLSCIMNSQCSSTEGWESIQCSISELNIDMTLASGQTFRWKKIRGGEWRGVLGTSVVALKQLKDDGIIKYKELGNISLRLAPEKTAKHKIKKRRVHRPEKDESLSTWGLQYDGDLKKRLHDYFQLDVSLSSLYNAWSQKDDIFRVVGAKYPGIRILRQDPVETVVAFICSSNNNIPRITSMVEKLCENFGVPIMEIEGHKFNTFPTFEALAGEHVEMRLRELGFGYRAKFISQTSQTIVQQRSHGWLDSLRMVPYEDARGSLLQLPGVGAKVADCICLMALDKSDVVPVDTHVWQIAVRDYLPHLSCAKTLSKKVYNEIGSFFKSLFGEYAGWAHSVLFFAHLQSQPSSKCS